MYTSNGVKNRFLLIMVLVFMSFGMAAVASAHEPRLVEGNQLIIIKNPDVSQAFYGELKGQAADFLIDLKTEQDLYLQILAPALPGIQKDKTITVEYAKELGQVATSFMKIEPGLTAWKDFYEEYAGDNYFQGPSAKKLAEPGYYIIKVTSPDNSGKYVLVVGDKEEFGAPEMLKALITIPQLKKNFFQEPISQWFNGKIGKYFGLGLLIIIIFGFMFHKFRQIYK